MIGNFRYYLSRQWDGFRARIRGRALPIHLAILAVFGIVFPWMRGIGFLDPVMISAYACLGVLFAGPAAAQAFASDRPQSMGDAAARLLMAVAYGESMAFLMLVAGLTTVYATRHFLFAPDLEVLAMAGLLGVSASLAAAAIAGWMTLALSAAAARQGMRVLFLALLVVFFYRSGWLPDIAGEAALISLAIAAAAWLALRRALVA